MHLIYSYPLSEPSSQYSFENYVYGVENLVGSAFSERLTGTESDNIIDGGLGAHRVSGYTGDDTLIYRVLRFRMGDPRVILMGVLERYPYHPSAQYSRWVEFSQSEQKYDL